MTASLTDRLVRQVTELGQTEARKAVRRIASGVTVLTVNEDGVRHGTTVSAIVPISRDPLLIGVCLRLSSAFTAMVGRSRLFSVNVLAAGQERLAARFAEPGRPLGDAQFAGLAWRTDPLTAAPVFDGCLAHLACRIADHGLIGDHDLVVAQVVGGQPCGADHDASDAPPLLSYAGRLATGRPAAPTHPTTPTHSTAERKD